MKYVNRVIKYITSACLGVMVVIVVLNTILRYVFSTSIIQTEELCRYLFMWTVYAAAITVWDEKGHICVTLLSDHFGTGTVGRLLRLAVALLSLWALGMLCYGSWLYFLETTMVGQVTNISYKMMILPVMLGGLICALLLIRDTAREWRASSAAGEKE